MSLVDIMRANDLSEAEVIKIAVRDLGMVEDVAKMELAIDLERIDGDLMVVDEDGNVIRDHGLSHTIIEGIQVDPDPNVQLPQPD